MEIGKQLKQVLQGDLRDYIIDLLYYKTDPIISNTIKENKNVFGKMCMVPYIGSNKRKKRKIIRDLDNFYFIIPLSASEIISAETINIQELTDLLKQRVNEQWQLHWKDNVGKYVIDILLRTTKSTTKLSRAYKTNRFNVFIDGKNIKQQHLTKESIKTYIATSNCNCIVCSDKVSRYLYTLLRDDPYFRYIKTYDGTTYMSIWGVSIYNYGNHMFKTKDKQTLFFVNTHMLSFNRLCDLTILGRGEDEHILNHIYGDDYDLTYVFYAVLMNCNPELTLAVDILERLEND